MDRTLVGLESFPDALTEFRAASTESSCGSFRRALEHTSVSGTLMDDEVARLREAIAMADGILDLVAQHAPAGVTSRDRNDQFLVLAFGRALRCFRSIRDVAGVHAEADDAAVLTRALLAMTLRAVWLAIPDDPEERLRRARALELDSIRQLRTQARSLERLSLDPGIPAAALDERIAELERLGVARVPPDEVIARELGDEAIYARIYRTTSSAAHYSLFTALQGFDASNIEGEIESLNGIRIRFLDGDPSRAEEALVLAALVYVAFLEDSELVVHHGVFDKARDLLETHVRRYPRR